MGAPKGSQNARVYHEANTKKRKQEILHILASIANRGLMVGNITALSNYVAEETGITAVTLRRNPLYREMLENHLVRQRGAASILTDRDRQIASLKAKMKVLELEVSNTKADKRRLEARLRRLSETTTQEEGSPMTERILHNAGSHVVDFECTAHVVLSLLERMDGLEIDEEKGVIIDRAARPGEQRVAGPNQCRPFIEWLKKRSVDGSS